jgi:hypothetical protein
MIAYAICPCGGDALPLPSGAYECLACGRTFTLTPVPKEAPRP